MKTRFVLMGGFLGAGKTTMISKVAGKLLENGIRLAVITNDQGEELVDTDFLSRTFSVGEVTGGCFCCNFEDLIKNTERLLSEHRSEIIFAEPVGSCTDLMATVIAPLKKMYPEKFSVAPLMVLVDVERLHERAFDRNSLNGYLRRHQVEEAEVILVSKTDLVNGHDLNDILDVISEINGSARVIPCSAVSGENLDEIIDVILSDMESDFRPVDIDYHTYAHAEAELGWYNGAFEFSGERYDSYDLISKVFRRLSSEYAPEDIAHAKIMLLSDTNAVKMSLVQGSITTGGISSSRYGEGVSRMIVNARIISEPGRLRDVLRGAVMWTISDMGLSSGEWRDDSFSPPPPKPTHRIN